MLRAALAAAGEPQPAWARVDTVADVEEARKRVRPSLDPAQVADLKAYAERRLD